MVQRPVIVIDVGAATHGRDSIAFLARMYHPKVIWAFDPHPYLDGPSHVEGVPVLRYREAAWVHRGTVSWQEDGSTSHIGGDERVDCFSLADLIESINPPIVLKLDAEGAELKLLEDLIARGVDDRLQEVLVEWHMQEYDFEARRRKIERRIRCPLKEWSL